MTDNEIIKALECCTSDECTCSECPYGFEKHIVDEEFEIMPNGKCYDDLSCDEWLKLDLFDLINRQKAEIESKDDLIHRQKEMIERTQKLVDATDKNCRTAINIIGRYERQFKTIKAEAIKEFINLLIDVAVCKDNGDGTESLYVSIAKARQVSKEMVGAESG